jgi:hypothetical protein
MQAKHSSFINNIRTLYAKWLLRVHQNSLSVKVNTCALIALIVKDGMNQDGFRPETDRIRAGENLL